MFDATAVMLPPLGAVQTAAHDSVDKGDLFPLLLQLQAGPHVPLDCVEGGHGFLAFMAMASFRSDRFQCLPRALLLLTVNPFTCANTHRLPQLIEVVHPHYRMYDYILKYMFIVMVVILTCRSNRIYTPSRLRLAPLVSDGEYCRSSVRYRRPYNR